MSERLVIDEFREIHHPLAWLGEGICVNPREMNTIFDYTDLRGSGSNLYYSLIYQVPKWGYVVKKVDEWIEVSPSYAEYYNITIAQKQKIEGAIKSGLASTSQAVADFELLSHDARRYGEIIEYFKAAKKDDHVLRSLFIDRIDAHTGEGYSMITMAKRWPTIITDFMRMKTEWTDPKKVPIDDQVKKILRELDVSQAEATILKTKNELYKKWKEMFFPVVKDRYARIEAMVNARKKSIDEYKNWLKPYLARYRMIREKTESKPSEYLSDAYMTPGFGQSQATTGVRIWMFKSFEILQTHKPESALDPKSGFEVNPYDKVVKRWIPKIEEKYKVKITDDDVEKLMKDAVEKNEMDPHELYYYLVEGFIQLDLTRTPPPQGVELDNFMIKPLKGWVISGNVMLLHLIELYARERAFDNYVSEILGTSDTEEKIREHIEKQFSGEEEKPEKEPGKLRKSGRNISNFADKFFHLFVKRGPYENTLHERLSKVYFRHAGGQYGKFSGFIMSNMKTK